ncbi:MAG: complex I NDUFA9 subunit family protein [Candidatus Methanoperedens sp.]|nr:complex I NDUFA9 subunit family protein [Candidatus Methanoperedens sp.]HLB70504.1 complex I NDUFA9 subunit family protein [Candidatus Methanoperedens sp.]
MILVTGGTGFVGSHLVRRLALEKIQMRCLVRKTSNIERLRDAGAEIAYGDVTDKESLKKAAEGVETVIHLVGIIVEHKDASFEMIHTRGTRNLVEACRESGVKRFIYISALGALENARSRYHKTKWEAEQIVIKSKMEYVIFRPSIMIGEWGGFITMLSRIVRQAPVVPILDGESRVQPIYVENTVDCIIRSLGDPETTGRIFEIAGPEQITYRELFLELMGVLGIKKPAIEIPTWLMWPAAYILERIMDRPPLTTQQLIMLQEDNICDVSEMQKVFDLKLVPFREALRTFLLD